MPDDQPEIPDDYADLVAAMVDTNSGTVKRSEPPRETSMQRAWKLARSAPPTAAKR